MGTTLSNLRPNRGATNEKRRMGRGPGSGLGTTGGRGQKGQGSRSGHMVRPGFEGGQMPLYRRLPKRGFKNPFRVQYAVVNVGDLAKRFAAGAEVTLEVLRERGLVPRSADRLKVLGDGALAHRLTVEAHAFSAAARAKIEKAGGTARQPAAREAAAP